MSVSRCVCYTVNMTTITIPKNFISNDDLVIIPRKQYESLLNLYSFKKEVVLSLSQKNRLQSARKNLKSGKFLTIKNKINLESEMEEWERAGVEDFFKSYNKSDAIYDQI